MQGARTTLAIVLLSGLLAALFPLAAISSGGTCKLACCAGRAPHAAGSCIDGTCHAFLGTHSSHAHYPKHESPEQFCGLSRLGASGKLVLVLSQELRDGLSKEAKVSSSALSKPCQTDCGGCASGFANSKRRRNVATVVNSNQPTQALQADEANAQVALVRQIRALRRQSAPRAPPPLFC